MMIIRLGVSKVDITPEFSVPLAGFAVRSELGAFEGVSHRLFARIFVFVTGDKDGDNDKCYAVLISADLIWWGSDRVPTLKRRIHERFGIAEDAILLHGTHTHSGPQTSSLFTSYLGVMDENYIALLEHIVIGGIEAAFLQAEPVQIEQSSGYSPLGINRRGVVKSLPETGPADHELRVIRFRKVDGTTKGLFVHYACHPVITRDNFVSSEYIGVAMEAVEQFVGEGTVAAFLQGTCGDINPGDGEQVIRGNNDVVMQVGNDFAECVINTLDKPMQQITPCDLQWRTTRVELPLKSLPERSQLELTAQSSGVLGEWSSLMLARLECLSPSIPLELIELKLGEELSLLGMNAEVVVDYGLYIKQISKGNVLPIGYTNGMFGYIPTAQQLIEGGYETHESTLYFAMPSSFDITVESTVKEALVNLLI
ncbi:neutral/alkaline non-lysosomal ceramidase N-terminal domain-containing protein [Paenibacillus sp. LjRoot56]|uniref:neutral/alkaline non-lysosomal ceramidase N-terminal domain-containing protein n=1 Tax=Paenibacillus sp. LjRoot56 TaxID=3342333 RepID=UPI003ECECD39